MAPWALRMPDPGGDAIPAETNRAAARANKGPTHWKEGLY